MRLRVSCASLGARRYRVGLAGMALLQIIVQRRSAPPYGCTSLSVVPSMMWST